MTSKKEVDAAWDRFFDSLLVGITEGKVEIVSIRTSVCGTCKIGTLKSSPTPNWMNRHICDHCGKQVSL